MQRAPAPDPKHVEFLHTLSFLDCSHPIPTTSLPPSLLPTWILMPENFLAFLQSHQPLIVHLHSASAHSYSALSSFLYTHVLPAVATINNHRLLTKLNTKPAGASTAIILAFSFATQDVRARSTAALFAFLTRQLLQQAGSMRLFTAVQHLYVSVAGRAAEASWQAGELWQAFQTVLAAVGRARAAPVYCVIDAVEKCDVDRREFLGDFWRLAEARDGDGHRVLKIIVTGSVASAGVGYALPAALVIDVDAREEAQENVEDYVGYEIARLAEARPAFRDLVEDIRAKILAVKPDVLVALLMCKWFLDNNAPSTPTEIQSVVDGMPQSLAEIYRQSYLKTRPYASRWDLKALYWIAHALQPLVLEELATATAVESSEGDFRVVEGNRPRCLAEDLKRAFGCFLDFHGDEVFLVHESAREFLLQSAKDWDPEGNSYSLAGHARIAGICINYLLLKDWEQLTSDYNEIETLPPREGTSSLLGYAAKYWHVHYGLAEKNQALFEKALSFLENTERRELWSQLEWLEGNKLASKRDTSDPELVAAELGLNDVLLSMIDKKPDDDHLRLRALEIASGRGDKALIDQLVERGVAVTESLALHHAAQTGQLGIVTYLLQNGAKVDAIDESNWTALFFASENGYLEIAVELLRNRANPNWKADKLTPLHLTAEFGNIDICRKLIEEDADVNASDENGLTPLHMATLSGQLKIMEMLLDHEAEIDCKDDTATRPLHQAASSGITEAVKLLVARNATLNATDDSGKTALYLAVEGEFSEIVQVLVGAKADINIAASEFGTPLHAAAIHGNLEIAMQLLDAGADLHIFNDSNFTVLHLAARYGHTSLVRTFLEDGAHVDESNAEGQTALQLAASNGNFGALQALINFNASVNVVNEAGWTPMAYVARRGDLRSVKALLAAGAEVDPLDQSLSPLQSAAERGQVEVMWVLIGAGARTELEDMEGDTPLHCAVKSGSVPAVQVLLDKKVNINAIDTKKERTPLLEAAILGYPEIVNLLLKVGANAGISDKDGSHFLHFAVKSSSMETLNLALDSSHDILVKDESDRIPLHVAAETGFTDGVERLLKVGHASAQIKATTAKERTHLHLTAKYGHLETAEALLKVGVDIEAIDEKHLTALHLATRREHLELAKLLVGKGADANKLDKDGRTPLFIAFEKGNLELIKLLFPKTRDIKAVNSRKETLLHLAVRIQFLDPVKDLIALGLDVNATNIDQSTPISLAVQYGNLDVVNALLGAKAKVNCVDKDERRALYWAIQSRENLEMVVAILETGEDPDEPGTMWPPMYTAAYFGKIDIVQEFLRRKLDVELCGSNGWAPLHAAFDNAEITRALLEAGAKVDPMNDDGNTPLHLAVAYSFDDTTRALLEKQADSLKRSKDGRTALHKAASAGNLEVMILMLNLVAGSVEIPDNDGNTPVWEAVNNGNSEVAQLLLERPGCDVNQTCGNKKTLLETALANEDLKTTELLIRRGAKITAADEPQLMTMAATEGNLPLVQLLLLQGVGVHETDAHGWTPEMLARAMNHVEVAEALKAARGEARDVAKALAPSGWSETKKSELLEVDEDGMGARHMRDPYVEGRSDVLCATTLLCLVLTARLFDRFRKLRQCACQPPYPPLGPPVLLRD
jgi:ankyrin repeat protein